MPPPYTEIKNFAFSYERLKILKTLGIPFGDTPTLNDGDDMPGALFFRTTDGVLLIWDGDEWLEGTSSDSNQVDVFLIGGQSNARGNGAASSSPNPESGTVYQYDAGVFGEVTDEVGNLPSGRGSIWPSFGINYYRLTGRKICFVPCAVDGSGQLTASDAGFGNWGTSGTLFSSSVDKTNDAFDAIIAAHFSPIFRGVLWGQGENDARKINDATITQSDYQTGLTNMIANYRTEFGINMPFYIYQTGTETSASDVGYAAVRAAQQAVADANPLLNKIISTNAFDFVARSLMADTIHYNQTGLNELGVIGSENVVNGFDLQWQRSGTSLSYLKGRIGIGIKLPGTPLHIIGGAEDPATLTVSGNAVYAIQIRNLNSGASASCGFRFSNDTGLGAQLLYNSSGNAFNPNGISFHSFSGEMLIGSNSGNLRFFVGSSGPLLGNTKMILMNNGSFGVGANPDDSAIFHITSTTKGFIMPKMTTTQRDAVSAPVAGLLIYNTTTKTVDQFDGTIWASLAGVSDHGGLTGLADDDHTQYVLLLGRSGGQTVIGSTVANELLTLRGNIASSSNTATNPNIKLAVGNSGGTVAGQLHNNGVWALGVVANADAVTYRMVIQQLSNNASEGIIIYPNANTGTYCAYGFGTVFSSGDFTIVSLTGRVNLNSVKTYIGGTSAPTAVLHVGPGGTSIAPEKNDSGSLLTTPEAGAKEYNNSFYRTNNALNRFGIGGVIANSITTVANSGSSPTTLVTYTTKASTLAATNELIRAEIRGTFNDAAGTETLGITFAGTSILSISPAGNPTGWRIAVTVVRTGSSTATAFVDFYDDLEFHNSVTTHVTGLTFTNTNALVLTGTSSNATANAIVMESYRVYWEPAAAN